MLYDPITTASRLKDYFIGNDRDYYSYEAYEAMLEYFDTEEPDLRELCIIELCDMFEEKPVYKLIEEFKIKEINEDIVTDEEEELNEVLAFLQKRTWAVKTVSGRILYRTFSDDD